MNKKIWILIIVIVAVLIGIGVYIYFNNNDKNAGNDYTSNRTSSSYNNTNNIDNTTSPEDNTIPQTTNNTVELNQGITTPTPVEEQIAIFSTTIYSKDAARQNNIEITCKALNGTIVKSGDTFSFCGIVGQSTTAKGYQEADIFDNNGNKKKGLGGGNCQISSTLYNALLSVDTLAITERHEHSNYVPYVKKGKDAAVAYGSYDLKFKNNYGNDVKIYAETTKDEVTIKLMSLK